MTRPGRNHIPSGGWNAGGDAEGRIAILPSLNHLQTADEWFDFYLYHALDWRIVTLPMACLAYLQINTVVGTGVTGQAVDVIPLPVAI